MADGYQYRTWPVFYSDIKFCKIWMKSIQPFKSYWTETKSVTTTPTRTTPDDDDARRRCGRTTWSPCVCHATQATQKKYQYFWFEKEPYVELWEWSKFEHVYRWTSDGLFTMADSNSFLSPYKILPIAQKKKKKIYQIFRTFLFFFLIYHEMVCCVYSLELPHRGDSNEFTQHTIIV